MNLKDLLDVDPLERLVTSIGDLSMFWLTIGDSAELLKDGGRALAVTDPSCFVRRLTKYVYYPSDQLREGKYKPEHPVLSDEELASLTDADIETIAAAYLRHNDYLYNEEMEERQEGMEQTGTQLGSGKTKHPKKDAESDAAYLSRLMLLYEDEQRKRWEGFHKRISQSFSAGLTENITRMQSLGEGLRKSLEKWPGVTGLNASAPQVKLADVRPVHEGIRIDFAEIARREQEAHERPFKELGKQLQDLITLTKRGTGFAIASNEVQTQIATELSKAIGENERAARRNTKLSWAVLLLTVFGLLIAIADVYRAYKGTIEAQNETQVYVNNVLTEVKGIRDSLDAARDRERNEWEELRSEVSRLRLQLDERSRNVQELKETLEEQTRQLDALRSAGKPK